MLSSKFSAIVFAILHTSMQHDAAAQDVCVSETKVFTVKVNLYASELGYFTFDECGDSVNPTLAMEIGEIYTFLQADRSNYMHPMGFAYYPDGAHADRPELEPAVAAMNGTNSCNLNATCSAPMYYSGDTYLGTYSNLLGEETSNEDNSGLDEYEQLFLRSIHEWATFPSFSVKLRFTDSSYNKDLFYFCHVHQFMSGRIKLTSNGTLVNQPDNPPLGYSYDQPGVFDEQCGTFALDAYELPNDYCPDRFVCGSEFVAPSVQTFARCIDAMNCHMLHGMTTGVQSQSEVALFIHQMIPHHQNAVNMAKALLYSNALDCADLANQDDPRCVMEAMMYDIINSQNHQIQEMRAVLKELNFPPVDDCDVLIQREAATEGSEAFYGHVGAGSIVAMVLTAFSILV